MPKRLIIEYEDGFTKGIDFTQLSKHSQLELSKLGLCPPPLAIPRASKNYLLLRWKDRWQEVIGVDEGSVELLRYYILERVEEVGRMALEVEGDYPMLLTIKRLPKELDSMVTVGSGKAKVYGFEPKGNKEEGGKIEHVEYDKAERHFQYEIDKNAETWIEQIVDSLKTELHKRATTPEKVLAMDQAERVKEYKELARGLGIRPMEKQEDVYGFVQLMLEDLAAART